MPIPINHFSEIAMDFVRPLPKSEGYDAMLVITDRLTNYILIKLTYSTDTAPDIAKVFH